MKLTVRILSFSCKLGIPVDETELGGGFVFDCRYLPNPWYLLDLRLKSGLDAEVKEYMEKIPAVESFLKYCFGLVDSAVEEYLSRGFPHLMVCF